MALREKFESLWSTWVPLDKAPGLEVETTLPGEFDLSENEVREFEVVIRSTEPVQFAFAVEIRDSRQPGGQVVSDLLFIRFVAVPAP